MLMKLKQLTRVQFPVWNQINFGAPSLNSPKNLIYPMRFNESNRDGWMDGWMDNGMISAKLSTDDDWMDS